MDWKPFLGLPLWTWLFVFPSILALICMIAGRRLRPLFKPLWKILDIIYTASGMLAAGFMIAILSIIVVQMICRWLGIQFQGSTDFAGYAMAATSFFALAHALNRGAHIRVSIVLNLNTFTRYWLNVAALFVAAITATYFARYAIKTNFMSAMINDRTQGIDQVPERLLAVVEMVVTSPAKWQALWESAGPGWIYTPMWLPQIPMSIGTVLLAVALWDNLCRLLVTGENPIQMETVKNQDEQLDNASAAAPETVR